MLVKFGDESNYAEAIAATEADLLLHGQAFWLRDVDLLQRLNASTIKVKKTREKITGFVQMKDGKEINRFERDDIIYFREFHPDDDLGAGVPVMTVIDLAVSMEYEATLYVERFFKNGAIPGVLLSTEQIVPEAEQSRMLAWWNRKFKGSKKSHNVGIADRGLKAQIISASMKDNALTDIRDQARTDICVGMRVPKILVGTMEEATYANAQEARKFMIEDLIIPRSNHFADVINADLISKIDPSLEFEFVPNLLPILQEDATSKWERLSVALEKGLVSDEFVRSEMSWPETAAPVEKRISDEKDIPPVLRSWSRKAKKALKRGESPNVEFDCYNTF
jgi:HK97 family phage portal protein